MTKPLDLITPITLPSGADGCHLITSRRSNGEYSPLLVMAHGAGAPFDHPHMTSIATALAIEGISTLRFNLPFMQAGKRRVDDIATSMQAISGALDTAKRLAPDAPCYLGGHSFGGRMATHLAAEQTGVAKALVLFSFPLHVSKKPAIKRAAHLSEIEQPMLFVSGTRDTLAEAALFNEVIDDLPNASLHWLETADHGYKILKRTRQSSEDVYAEAARVTAEWMGLKGLEA